MYIKIETLNAAFKENDQELNRILNTVTGEYGQVLRDINGNRVGEVSHTTEAETDIWKMLQKLNKMFSCGEINNEVIKKMKPFFDKYEI